MLFLCSPHRDPSLPSSRSQSHQRQLGRTVRLILFRSETLSPNEKIELKATFKHFADKETGKVKVRPDLRFASHGSAIYSHASSLWFPPRDTPQMLTPCHTRILPPATAAPLQEKDVMKMFRAAGMGPTSYELEKYMQIMDGRGLLHSCRCSRRRRRGPWPPPPPPPTRSLVANSSEPSLTPTAPPRLTAPDLQTREAGLLRSSRFWS